jgi:rsbT co-antagonist protein RsbR
MANVHSRMAAILSKYDEDLVADWNNHLGDGVRNDPRVSTAEILEQTREFVGLLKAASSADGDVNSVSWQPVREFLEEISRSRAEQGFASDETASFVFSFKKPLFERLRQELGDNSALADEMWMANEVLDDLGLHTIKTFQKSREAVIGRQQEELLELSTPVVKLWEGVLALPMIGTLDSARTQVVMESLLQKIVDTASAIAIIDITGVPTVDTMTAQHLLKTVGAIRLMGSDCIISGIRPQIAQTIVHLGVSLRDVTTKATLADALALALKRLGLTVSRGPS